MSVGKSSIKRVATGMAEETAKEIQAPENTAVKKSSPKKKSASAKKTASASKTSEVKKTTAKKSEIKVSKTAFCVGEALPYYLL